MQRNEREFLEFTGAMYTMMEEGQEWMARGPVQIRRDAVTGFYDHMILLGDHKVKVMEDYREICKRIRGYDPEKIRKAREAARKALEQEAKTAAAAETDGEEKKA